MTGNMFKDILHNHWVVSIFSRLVSTSGNKTSVITSSTGTTAPNSKNGFEPRTFHRKLFTPDVINITNRVKTALVTYNPEIRHAECKFTIENLRKALLKAAQVSPAAFTAIPINGCRTTAMETVLRTMFDQKSAKLLVMENGIHGKELLEMGKSSRRRIKSVSMGLKHLQDTLFSTDDVDGLIVVHCEPYSGLVNPIHQIGEIVKKLVPTCVYIVDATMTFGAMPVNMQNIDILIGESGKCLQGPPGMSFVIAKKSLLEGYSRRSDSLVLDLIAYYNELQKTGQLPFSPPIHTISAFKEALFELSDEGGVKGRRTRYQSNNALMKKGMAEIGFEQLYADQQNPDGYFTTLFCRPINPLFVFEEFRSRLDDHGFVIMDYKHAQKGCFCLGNIGDLHREDVIELLQLVRQVCQDMRLTVPIEPQTF